MALVLTSMPVLESLRVKIAAASAHQAHDLDDITVLCLRMLEEDVRGLHLAHHNGPHVGLLNGA